VPFHHRDTILATSMPALNISSNPSNPHHPTIAMTTANVVTTRKARLREIEMSDVASFVAARPSQHDIRPPNRVARHFTPSSVVRRMGVRVVTRSNVVHFHPPIELLRSRSTRTLRFLAITDMLAASRIFARGGGLAEFIAGA
jgi:hypothetical protein